MHHFLTEQIAALDIISFWLNSTKIHAPSAPLMIIGTHLDYVDSVDDLTNINLVLG
jgi:hypothetical protein